MVARYASATLGTGTTPATSSFPSDCTADSRGKLAFGTASTRNPPLANAVSGSPALSNRRVSRDSIRARAVVCAAVRTALGRRAENMYGLQNKGARPAHPPVVRCFLQSGFEENEHSHLRRVQQR